MPYSRTPTSFQRPQRIWQDIIVRIILTGAAVMSIVIVGLIFLSWDGRHFRLHSIPDLASYLTSAGCRIRLSTHHLEFRTGLRLAAGHYHRHYCRHPLRDLGRNIYLRDCQAGGTRVVKTVYRIAGGYPVGSVADLGILIMVPYTGYSALAGGLALAVMAIPTIISVSEDAIHSVPESYKQASLAMGASKIQTIWRIIVPASFPALSPVSSRGGSCYRRDNGRAAGHREHYRLYFESNGFHSHHSAPSRPRCRKWHIIPTTTIRSFASG